MSYPIETKMDAERALYEAFVYAWKVGPVERTRVLLQGGPLDGKWIELPEGIWHHDVALVNEDAPPDEHGSPAVDIYRYVRDHTVFRYTA